MSEVIEFLVPDVSGYRGISSVGDMVEKEQALVTLESDT
jgi:hypothetical protein